MAAKWLIRSGAEGTNGEVPLLPAGDPQDISAAENAGTVTWTISGDRASLKSAHIDLPAGWYLLTATMISMEGGVMSPALQPDYADVSVPGQRITLTDPDEDGSIVALVLLTDRAAGMSLIPSVSPVRFQIRDLALTRVSRWRALRIMLGYESREGLIRARLGRTGRFMAGVRRSGVSGAAGHLFTEYQRRLRIRGPKDYATWISRYENFGLNEVAAESALDPLVRFAIGIATDKALTSSELGRAVWRLGQECKLLAASDFFDAPYYLRNNPDVARAGIDPLLHFCKFGWQRLRNPSADFDVWWYWSEHLDPTREAINPLVHYALVGHEAGLQTRPPAYRPSDDGQRLAAEGKIRRVCLFAGYDPQGRIDDSMLDYLRELSRHADVYYLADCVMQHGELERLRGCVKGAWAIRHGAYDFGSYSLLARELVGWDTIETYDELILANDSCYLVRKLDEVFSVMRARACDWWGMQATKGSWATRGKQSNRFSKPVPMTAVKERLLEDYNREYVFDFHLGSYFLVLRQPVIADPGFRKRLDAVAAETSKLNIIRKYEIGIGRYLMARGHSFDTYIDALYPFHPVYSAWAFELIKKGFPFFKRYFLSENHYRYAGLLDWKDRLRSIVPDAPVQHMEQNLLRVTDYEKLYRNLRVELDRRGQPQWPKLLSAAEFEREDAQTPTHDHWWAFTACAFSNSFSGNERALFEEVKNDPSIKKIVLTRRKHVDVDGENVVVLPLRSREGQYHLMRARQIFIKHSPARNLVYPLDPLRHNIINLWHGIPLKRIGYASLDMQHRLDALSEQHRLCKAVISSSKVDTMAMASAFYPLSYNDVWLTGLPRNDFILRDAERLPSHLQEQLERLRVQLDGRKLILFVPTFKHAQHEAYYPFSSSELTWLGEWLERNNAVLGVREHMADNARTYSTLFAAIGALDLGDNRFADVEMLYRQASVLVTDYSSCFIDFMLTGRPMLSFAYDYDNYITNERGLFYDLDLAFPGPVCKSFEALRSALIGIFQGPDDQQRAEYAFKRRLFFDNIDDANSARLVQKVLTTYTSNQALGLSDQEEN